jgi:hypothetical protein
VNVVMLKTNTRQNAFINLFITAISPIKKVQPVKTAFAFSPFY